MRGTLRNLRAALDAEYERELALMRDRYPWVKGYELLPPVRRWHAIHLASGALIGPAKNITQLGNLILADDQDRPLRHPVTAASEHPSVAALEYAWRCEIIPAGDGWLAVRGDGCTLSAATPDALRDQMLRRWAAAAVAVTPLTARSGR